MEEICCPKHRLTLIGLYWVAFQKTDHFIASVVVTVVTAVRISYPTTNRLLAELHNGCHTTLHYKTVAVSIVQNANKFPSCFVRHVLRSVSNKTYDDTFMSSVQNFSRRTWSLEITSMPMSGREIDIKTDPKWTQCRVRIGLIWLKIGSSKWPLWTW
jgi:hypothetical protein